MGTIGAVVGKFAGRYATDRFGGRLTFFVGVVVSALGVAGFAASRSADMCYLMPRLTLSSSSREGLSLRLLFLFGMCVSPCCEIPVSDFSIEFGGPHAGFLIALLDALAFGVTAVFHFYAGEIAEQSWPLFLIVMFGVCVWSMLATLLCPAG